MLVRAYRVTPGAWNWWGNLQTDMRQKVRFTLQGNGFRTLAENQTVRFDLTQTDKGPKAANVVKL